MRHQNSLGRTSNSRNTLAAAAFVGAAAALATSALAVPTVNKGTGTPEQRNPAGNRIDQRLSLAVSYNGFEGNPAGGRQATGDATLTFTGAPAVSNNFSTPGTWSAIPAAGDTFNVTSAPGGDSSAAIIVNNDQGLAFGAFTVTRPTDAASTTLTGGYNGTAIQSIRGNTIVNGGTHNLSLRGAATTANTSIVAGNVAGQTGSLTFQGGAVVNYGSVRVGLSGSNGNLTVTGVGTTLNQVYDNTLPLATQQAVFGSSGAANNTNITIANGGTVNTLNAFHSLRGSFNVNAGGTLNVNSISTTGPEGVRQIGGLINMGQSENSTITTNVNGGVVNLTGLPGAGFDSQANFDKYAELGFGTAAGAVTSFNLTNGGKLNLTDAITYMGGNFNGNGGTAPALPTTLATSTTTVNVDGPGSAITGSASSRIEFGGSSAFINYAYGTTNVNVTNGGLITANFISFSAGDRSPTLANGSPASAQATNVTIGSGGQVVVGGIGAPDATGFLNFSLGDNSTTNVTVNSGGHIESTVIRTASNGGTTTFNINAGGTVETLALQTGRNVFGQGTSGATTTVNINGGALSGSLELGVIGINNTSTVNVTNGGTITGENLDTAANASSVANLNISGSGSTATFTGQNLIGGEPTDVASGVTNIVVSAQGTLNLGTVFVGTPDALGTPPAAAGSNFTVTGVGSTINVLGRPTEDPPLSATLALNYGANSKSTVNVLNGGVFNVLQTVGTPNLSGLVVLASIEGSTGTINVDGAGSTFNAGRALLVTQSDSPAEAFGGATGIVNVINGGKLTTNNAIQLSIGEVFDSTATLNVGGGAGPADASSLVQTNLLLVGGSDDDNDVAVVGAPATVNLNNGKIDVVSTAVYAGSNVNIAKGELNSAGIAVRGGKITMSPTAAPGVTRLVGDEYLVDNEGVIDIGKSGGISFITGTDTTATEIANIKGLIVAGRAGQNNSIKSSVLTSNSAIGYALRAPGGVGSFLGFTFEAADNALLFRVTLKGDVDLSGLVDFDDLVPLAQNYGGTTGKEWFQGDFDYDGDVDFDDLVPLAQNYGGSYSLDEIAGLGGADFATDFALAMSLAPEPASLSVLIAAAGILGRRRR